MTVTFYLFTENCFHRCFHAVDEPAATFILEDMKASHYSLANRSVGLDENHCRIVLEKLAQFHAASILLINGVRYRLSLPRS